MPLLCFASPKGGVGKTTLAAAVAQALAASGQRVIALDLDEQNALGLQFGMALDDPDGFVTGLSKAGDPHRAWHAALRPGPNNLQYLPYGRVGLNEALAFSQAFAQSPRLLTAPLADMLGGNETTVVIDMPPRASPAFSAVLPMASLLVCVLAADAASVALIPSVENGRIFGELRCPTGFVLNLIDMRSSIGRASWETATRHLGDRLLGTVYRDESVREAAAMQRIVSEHAPACKASNDVAALSREITRRVPPALAGKRTLREVA